MEGGQHGARLLLRPQQLSPRPPGPPQTTLSPGALSPLMGVAPFPVTGMEGPRVVGSSLLTATPSQPRQRPQGPRRTPPATLGTVCDHTDGDSEPRPPRGVRRGWSPSWPPAQPSPSRPGDQASQGRCLPPALGRGHGTRHSNTSPGSPGPPRQPPRAPPGCCWEGVRREAGLRQRVCPGREGTRDEPRACRQGPSVGHPGPRPLGRPTPGTQKGREVRTRRVRSPQPGWVSATPGLGAPGP